ncbi:MAG: Crp/Fnr family transcriptional regulator [Bacteroidota bacterium]|nr:Crp/Fnr family transcriptional regulator [Flavisolibacter sp.]MBD0367754.1 Crp/Fnr family transcriptional regulator [Flavisolibacter sp.]MDQ3842623.1 Crp/Fnr family transcriptional regulator [Bacteroidota bacterium]
MFDEMKNFYLRNLSLFRHLSEAQLAEVANVVRFKQVYRCETVQYGSGDFSKIFFVIKGKIKLIDLDEENNELVKDILTEGAIFGDLELDGTPDGDELAQALTANTIVCYFNVNNFKKLMEAMPSLALNYAKAVSSKLRRLEDRHADLVFRDAKSRLITFIKNWARTDGNKVGDKIVLNNYLTHTDIANFISTSRQSVNVLLNELRDSGMLFYNRKRIELNNPMVWN